MSGVCPEHGPPSEPDHRYCEVCGRDLTTGEPPREPDRVTWLSSRATHRVCAGCGDDPGPTPFCDHCGRRCPVGQHHVLLDLGTIAGCTDRGRRRRHNEDALALGRLGDATAAVVCDGVSTSSRADVASHDAVDAAAGALFAALAAGDAAEAAIVACARAATAAARAAALPGDGDKPPSCTFVAAIVTADTLTIGWIGDSRAYWVGAEPVCLTIDDSVAGQVNAGRPLPAGLDVDPASKALTRWLGADADGGEPQIVFVKPKGPGQLLLCSDGLFNYLDEPERMADAVTGLAGRPAAVTEELTRLAIDAGGHDNIAVVLLPYPPEETP